MQEQKLKKKENQTKDKRDELIKIYYFTINKHEYQWSSLSR